ncbi:MAG TPA: prephenate dehydrogenase [Ferruginibacter sp.]|nr:prephenate dehydrogenase [Ferruginibacter sp.]
MNITIIGLGLIGGSIALTLRKKNPDYNFIGVDKSLAHREEALKLGLIDEVMEWEDAIHLSDLVIIAVPVDATLALLPQVLDKVSLQVVMDVGSSKKIICESIKAHPKKGRFVSTHPMWGTEFSGPAAAVSDGFKGKAAVVCNIQQSDADAIKIVEKVYEDLGMHIIYMDAGAHDIHTAYISHVSHITSFALANTVLEKEKEDDKIFELASGGFESTVRLAKSNPEMWVPIFRQNRDNVLDVLNEHISQLRKFKSCLEKENYEYLAELIANANTIRRILK